MTRRRALPRFDVMTVPGHRDDGADTAWFVTDRRKKPGGGVFVGDGDAARPRAFALARSLNAGGSR